MNIKVRRTYSHQELAVLYFPDILPPSASKQLSRWILRDGELMDDLLKAGYSRKQRTFSPMQAAILFDHIGHPDTFNIK